MEFQGQNEKDFVEETISNNKYVSFSKSWCPYCCKVKEVFQGISEKLFVVELDLIGDDFGTRIQQRLKEVTGQGTVPNIFINGKHFGGCSDLLHYVADGMLKELLDNTIEKYDFDLVVIGGGSGGLSASKEAAKYGKRVAVCDYVSPSPIGTTWGLGGTCVNVGCIPKKLMHQAALLREAISDAGLFGWEVSGEVTHNWKKLVDAIQNHIKSLNWNYKKQLREKSVVYYNALAKLNGNHTIELFNQPAHAPAKITTRNILIAVGGRPHYPEIPGAKEYCITSDDLFSLPYFPGKTLIIGASYIALECAGFLHGLKADCTVMVRSILLRGFDRDVAEKVGQHMAKIGIKFLYKCVPTKVEKIQDGVPPTLMVQGIYEDNSLYEENFNTVILAIGRDACTSTLGLGSAGVKINQDNLKIIVDKEDRTSVSNIFAIGDVALGRQELTPVAIQAGQLLAQRLYNSSTTLMDYNCVPTTVFTPLEYGCVGLNEEQAALVHQAPVEVFHTNFVPLEKVLALSPPVCYAKLICVPGVDKALRVVGLHVLGPNSGEIVQGFALAIKMGATKKQFDEIVGVHPTCAEVVTNMTTTKSSGKELNQSGC